MADVRQVFFRAENVAIIHIAASPVMPEKLVDGVIQSVQIGNRRKLVHLVAQCQEIRFATIQGSDIEEV